jgi:putative membrane protein
VCAIPEADGQKPSTHKMINMAEASEDPRTYFAAERTFLAWIRTGLGLMGIGFAVSRFGLFLREMRPADLTHAASPTGMSLYSGVALVALGVLVNVAAVAHHLRTVRELRTGTWTAGRVSRSAVALALLLALMGVGMGVYLLFLR